MIDWRDMAERLDSDGHAIMKGILPGRECESLVATYDADEAFRSTIDMARHGFGRGQYRYFARPLPDIVGRLRAALFPPLAAIANGWSAALGLEDAS